MPLIDFFIIQDFVTLCMKTVDVIARNEAREGRTGQAHMWHTSFLLTDSDLGHTPLQGMLASCPNKGQ